MTSDAAPSVENTTNTDIDHAAQSEKAPVEHPVSPQGSSGQGSICLDGCDNQKRGQDQDGGEDAWVSAESGSIGDDIAALEEELREEEGLLLDGDNGDGEGGVILADRIGGKGDAVQKAAWCLFEVLLPRCVGLEGQGQERRLEEPTRFSDRYTIRATLTTLLRACVATK